MIDYSKPYWAVIADGIGPVTFHYKKDADKFYNNLVRNHFSAPELYRLNQQIITNGKWRKL